jgi:hypothetical protein
MLQTFALYLSFIMTLFLFSYAYIEGLKIANTEGRVRGGTFIFSVAAALIFSSFTFTFV